jgi:hypothetical protein
MLTEEPIIDFMHQSRFTGKSRAEIQMERGQTGSLEWINALAERRNPDLKSGFPRLSKRTCPQAGSIERGRSIRRALSTPIWLVLSWLSTPPRSAQMACRRRSPADARQPPTIGLTPPSPGSPESFRPAA